MMVRAPQKPPQRGIQSIAIGWRVLDCLASAPKAIPLKDIAERTAMPASKVRFYLVSFLQLGLVVQDPVSGHYGLGPHAIKLGLAALEQMDVIAAARREVHVIADTLGFTTFLAVWGNHGPSIVYRVDGQNRTVLEVRVGTVLPLLNSALGRLFLALMPRATTNELLTKERAQSPRSRAYTAVDVERLVKQVRADRVASASGTLLAGFTAVACAVVDRSGLPVAAISVTGPIDALDDRPTGKPARLLLDITHRLSEEIGGMGAIGASR
jgi:DNA-binding IclR family transcriptional regulator